MKIFLCGLYAMSLFGFAMPVWAADDAQQQIRQIINKTYDKPDALVSIPIVVIAGEYALADWQQEKKGGRALLQRQAQGWQILACGGAGFRQAHALQQAGLSAVTAKSLTNALALAEEKVEPAQRQLYDSFDATMSHPKH